MKKDFITTGDFTKKELTKIIDNAIRLKSNPITKLENKILTLIFANPSLRTRLSFESGMKKLGGEVNIITSSDSWDFEYKDKIKMNTKNQEHIKEAAQVISKYCDIIGLRKSELMSKTMNKKTTQTWEELKKDIAINSLAKYATKPVINLESNMYHPCQSLADMMTIIEKHKEIKKKKYLLTWAPHPKALPLATPHSQLLTPCIFGLDVTLAHPPGFTLDKDIIKTAKEKSKASGGSLKITNDQESAFKNVDIIVAKSWASLKYFGDWEKESQHRKQFDNWIINSKKMSLTNNASFMHCLPVRRNVVVTDKVIDSKNSCVIDQAENRMWIQIAILSHLLKKSS